MSIFYSILLNLGFFLIGYIFIGSLNTSIILSNRYKKDDIRKHNSHNAGATNSLRTYGKRFALIVFFIDVLKTIIPVLILAALLNHVPSFKAFGRQYFISPQSLGLGVIFGHVFPLFFKFKGGKGVACSVGLLATINIICFILAAAIFFTIVAITKLVSLGSILTAAIIIPFVFIPWMTQGILGYWSNFIELNNNMRELQDYWYVSGIIFTIAMVLVIASHHSNIKKLIAKKEAKL